MITRLEELALNAWPAVSTLVLDGWILRFSGGYTRRANSVAPLYPGSGALDARVAACEEHYRRQGLPVIFKLTPESQPQGLDELLAASAYQTEAHTNVQLLELETWQAPEHAACDLKSTPDEAWQAAFAHLSGMDALQRQRHARILASIQPACCYASLHAGGQVAACGLGVLQDGFLGLFDIVVAAGQRRQGHAERLVRDLLAWGQRGGAHTSYLQVMCDNSPALRLYAKVGYRQAYTYWYRVKR